MDTACSAPREVLARTLKAGLSAAAVEVADIRAGDMGELSELPDAARHAVLDEIVAGSDFPMVVVGERVACVGGVDVSAVVAALA